MKKITLLFIITVSFSFAQQPQSYTDLNSSDIEFNTSYTDIEAIVTRLDNGRQPLIETFTSRVDFDAAYVCATLVEEDFAGGPGVITPCGLIISSAGDACFAAGEIEDGFDIQASNATAVGFIPVGALGNTIPLVGANIFPEFTIVNFSGDVYAIANDLWNSDPTTEYRIYDSGGVLMDTFMLATKVGVETFFGFTSDELISRVEIDGLSGSGELFGNLAFGDCPILSVEDNLADLISIYPNPARDILNIKLPSNIEIISSNLYDILGKDTGVRLINGTMNTSNLARGVYILNLKTSAGSLIQKVIKQ